MLVYPRLPTRVAHLLISQQSMLSPEELAQLAAVEHPQSEWYPTATHRATSADLARLRQGLVEIATTSGFPGRVRLNDFDQSAGKFLNAEMHIVTADAAHEGVWSFLSLVLAPDIAHWRYENRRGLHDYERLLGRPRNVFRRLWWRAHSLGSYADSLLEDELVGIMERPSIGMYPPLAQAVAAAHLAALAANPDIARTQLARDAIKRLRRLMAVVSVAGLSAFELRILAEKCYEESATAHRAAHTT